MKKVVLIALIAVYVVSFGLPAYAADKRAENNKKIADFVADTLKFPYVLIGSFVKQDHKKVTSEVDYKGHKTLGEALRKK
ncbi:MAG: hypothetical protein JW800_06435 [Candidatus Omnitrophica bacterium]|nr:hypothetical protein [Candidatus Omnitrophota bacterium]